VTLDELKALCQEAARELSAREGHPLPAAVIVPTAERTAVATLPDFPDTDEERFRVLSHFAADRMVPVDAPCFGFVAEAALDAGEEAVDVVLVAYGARQRGTWIAAAPLRDGTVGEFGDPEQLDAAALPFLRPLQHAADLATAGGDSDDVLGL
jgi:hypothetical protein